MSSGGREEQERDDMKVDTKFSPIKICRKVSVLESYYLQKVYYQLFITKFKIFISIFPKLTAIIKFQQKEDFF